MGSAHRYGVTCLFTFILAVACGGTSTQEGTGTSDGGAGTAGDGGSRNGGSGAASSGGSSGSANGGSSGGGSGGASGNGAGGDAGSGTGGTGTGGAGGTGGTAGSSTGGSAGATGTGGKGGTGGMGECRSGVPCDTEGATCLEPGCCPCSYRCQNGMWSIAACPACLPPLCPMLPPTNGAPCDECQHPVGEACSYPSTGGGITAVCNGKTWTVNGGTTKTCVDGDDCDAGQVCFYSGGLSPVPAGICVANPCGSAPLSCACAESLCFGGPCVKAADGVVQCECFTC